MIPIGEFARLGQVSVRMLRHYDSIGLLHPTHTDPFSGYRYYAASQLARLNRIVAFKGLGLTLEQVGSALAEDLDIDHLRGMLRLRRAELEQEQDLAGARLTDIEHRLHLIDKENAVPDTEYVIKPLPALRLAAKRGHVQSQPEISAFVGQSFGQLAGEIMSASGPGHMDVAIATYDMSDDGIDIVVGYEYDAELPGAERVDLPAVEQAVCAIHLGSMEGIGAAWQALATWIEAQGLQPASIGRENYVNTEPQDDQSQWVTELQWPVQREQ
ncbi:MAG: MerR family transcriptional regulator [Ornithinimicrobium sp.]